MLTNLLNLICEVINCTIHLQINPLHNVPCLTDGDFAMNESMAIIMYLAEKYNSKAPDLYPLGDLQLRARINQRLMFSSNVLWAAIVKCFVSRTGLFRGIAGAGIDRLIVLHLQAPIAFRGQKETDAGAVERLTEVLNWLRDFVAATGYVASTPTPTVADYATLAMYTTLKEGLGDYFIKMSSDWPELDAWAEKVKATVPNYERANGEGVGIYKTFWEKRKLDLEHTHIENLPVIYV